MTKRIRDKRNANQPKHSVPLHKGLAVWPKQNGQCRPGAGQYARPETSREKGREKSLPFLYVLIKLFRK